MFITLHYCHHFVIDIFTSVSTEMHLCSVHHDLTCLWSCDSMIELLFPVSVPHKLALIWYWYYHSCSS